MRLRFWAVVFLLALQACLDLVRIQAVGFADIACRNEPSKFLLRLMRDILSGAAEETLLSRVSSRRQAGTLICQDFIELQSEVVLGSWAPVLLCLSLKLSPVQPPVRGG